MRNSTGDIWGFLGNQSAVTARNSNAVNTMKATANKKKLAPTRLPKTAVNELENLFGITCLILLVLIAESTILRS
jgi:hypothetical protein